MAQHKAEEIHRSLGYAYTDRGVGRNFSRGGGVVLNVNFKKVLFALISALILYIGNV